MKNNKEEVRGRKIVHVRQFYQLYLAGADLTYKLNELEATGKRIRSCQSVELRTYDINEGNVR